MAKSKSIMLIMAMSLPMATMAADTVTYSITAPKLPLIGDNKYQGVAGGRVR